MRPPSGAATCYAAHPRTTNKATLHAASTANTTHLPSARGSAEASSWSSEYRVGVHIPDISLVAVSSLFRTGFAFCTWGTHTWCGSRLAEPQLKLPLRRSPENLRRAARNAASTHNEGKERHRTVATAPSRHDDGIPGSCSVDLPVFAMRLPLRSFRQAAQR
jgi:hypothetical protein